MAEPFVTSSAVGRWIKDLVLYSAADHRPTMKMCRSGKLLGAFVRDRREERMRLPKRDLIATGLVAVAGVLYLLWAADAAPPGLTSMRATGLVMLGLGFAASASAVVPRFDNLIHGSKTYLAVTSLIGLVAFGAGLWMLLETSELALGVLMATMAVLWLIATVHHVLLAETTAVTRPIPRTTPRGPHPAGIA
jgi:hypothetical protein